MLGFYGGWGKRQPLRQNFHHSSVQNWGHGCWLLAKQKKEEGRKKKKEEEQLLIRPIDHLIGRVPIDRQMQALQDSNRKQHLDEGSLRELSLTSHDGARLDQKWLRMRLVLRFRLFGLREEVEVTFFRMCRFAHQCD